MGADWELENPEGKIIATIRGDRKKHNFEVLTSDQQTIARCSEVSKDSYGLDLLSSSFDPFLALCYVLVLDFATVGMEIRGGF